MSDSDSATIRAFGLLNEEVPKNSPFHGVPHPVTYLIDARGVIKAKYSEEDNRRRYTTGNILTDQLNIRTGTGTTIKNPRISVTTGSSDQVVRGGERIRLIVDVQLPRGMHVYSPGVQGYIPIEWKLAETEAFEPIDLKYPPSRTLRLKAINETVPVYDKSFTLQREIIVAQPPKMKPRLNGSNFTIEGSFRYQACDDTKCYVPETIPLKWEFKFEPHDSERVPPELRRKAPG